MLLKIGVIGAFSVLLLVGVNTAHSTNDPKADTVTTMKSTDATAVELTEEQNGGVVAVMINDRVRIQLEGNPTTGFVWESDHLDTTMLEPVGQPKFTPNNNLAGGNGTFTFTFKALKMGVTNLHLIYYRPFEKNTPPARIFAITTDIQQ